MKRPQRQEMEVFSLSAIDIFASAMGAFVIISIILMKYYQNETISETQLEDVADLLFASESSLDDSKASSKSLLEAKARYRAEISNLEDEKQKLIDQMDAIVLPEIPDVDSKESSKKVHGGKSRTKVSFRFLGMKTTKIDFSILVEMSRVIGAYHKDIESTVDRIFDSLGPQHRFELVGYRWINGRVEYLPIPSAPGLIDATDENKQLALDHLKNQRDRYAGSNSILEVVENALKSESGAIFVVSAGLPFPPANRGMNSDRIIRALSASNRQNKEIHTVAVGHYFKYDGALQFLFQLASENNGGFMAL